MTSHTVGPKAPCHLLLGGEPLSVAGLPLPWVGALLCLPAMTREGPWKFSHSPNLGFLSTAVIEVPAVWVTEWRESTWHTGSTCWLDPTELRFSYPLNMGIISISNSFLPYFLKICYLISMKEDICKPASYKA